jgi:hypothetical protein
MDVGTSNGWREHPYNHMLGVTPRVQEVPVNFFWASLNFAPFGLSPRLDSWGNRGKQGEPGLYG